MNTRVQAPRPHQAASVQPVAAEFSCHKKWGSLKPKTCRSLVPRCPGRALWFHSDWDPVTPNWGLAVGGPGVTSAAAAAFPAKITLLM